MLDIYRFSRFNDLFRNFSKTGSADNCRHALPLTVSSDLDLWFLVGVSVCCCGSLPENDEFRTVPICRGALRACGGVFSVLCRVCSI
ncbi:MAG TPA: hypothetical protein DCR20_03410 [Planctomycetaceae bacterium]|nr:hypothetical protein [Planctomycetaceae bacterium]